MTPTSFRKANVILLKPDGVPDDECGPLPIYTDGATCVSCWSLTWHERLRVLFSGKIWLWVWSGRTQPPVAIDVEDPFKRLEERARAC